MSPTSGTFALLPEELELMVLAHLPCRDLAALERSSSHFRDLILGKELWRKRAEVRGREDVVRLEEDIKEMRELKGEIIKPDLQVDGFFHNFLHSFIRGFLSTTLEFWINLIEGKKIYLEKALVEENWKKVFKMHNLVSQSQRHVKEFKKRALVNFQ